MGKRPYNSILFLVQLPPPVHGVGLINQMVWQNVELPENWEKCLLELRFSERTEQIRQFNLTKIFRFLSTWFKLLGLLLCKRISHVYFSIVPTLPGFYRDFFYVVLIKLFRKVPVYHFHLMGIEETGNKRIFRSLFNWTFSNSVIIHPSEKIYQTEFKNQMLRNTKIFFQANGIREANLSVYRNTGKSIRIIHISHLYKFKGLPLLLDVFQELVNEGKDVYLDIIGDTADSEVLESILKAGEIPNVGSRLIWHGLLTGEQKNKILAQADIFAFTSLKDTFPLVILEGMQQGIPIVASDTGAIPEILEDELTGLIYEAGNNKQLKKKLELLILNEDLRKRLVAKASESFNTKYTAEHFLNGMNEIFESISELHKPVKGSVNGL